MFTLTEADKQKLFDGKLARMALYRLPHKKVVKPRCGT
jgi:hypothetical protein